MRLPFGFHLTFSKASPPSGLVPPASRGREWWPMIREPFSGAWQRNSEQTRESVLAHSAVYSCVTLIASDISKMRLRLVEQDAVGIWKEAQSPAFTPVLRKPNRYQNRIKFIEQWLVSKLLTGNTYILLQRDERKVVVAMYILDPSRTKVLVAPDGSVFYRLTGDNLSGIEEDGVVVPASEIIHDTMVPLFHPLCGVSPIFACGLAALQGLSIQNNSTKFFENGALPGGVLTAPGTIDDITADRLKEHWEKNYTGEGAGKIAVLGDGLRFEKLVMSAVESQVIDQLKWTSETVCSCFHVPAYMIGAAPTPAYTNVQALNQQYYSQCLQAPIESIELCLDEGLGLNGGKTGERTLGTEFDLDDLLRMDTSTQITALANAVKGSIMTPNTALKKLNLAPVTGGDTIYMQQQNFSLEALSKRDSQEDPFATAKAPVAVQAGDKSLDEEDDSEDDGLDQEAQNMIAGWSLKEALDYELSTVFGR